MDLTGERYGKLTAVKVVGSAADGHRKWLCVCECGNERVVAQNHLKREGGARACKECARRISAEKRKTHGDFGTRLYSIYYGMITRVYNKNDPNYKRYGARGVKICDEWAKSYVAFKDWAINNGYSDDLSIDRVDVNGNYCPENCRWATAKMQGNNRRNNRRLTINGQDKTITEWADEVGLSATAIRNRLCKGYGLEESVFTPYRKAKALKGGETE